MWFSTAPRAVAAAAAATLLYLALLPASVVSASIEPLVEQASGSFYPVYEEHQRLPAAPPADVALAFSPPSSRRSLRRQGARTTLSSAISMALLLSASAIVFLVFKCAWNLKSSLHLPSAWGPLSRSLAAGDSPCEPEGDEGAPEAPAAGAPGVPRAPVTAGATGISGAGDSGAAKHFGAPKGYGTPGAPEAAGGDKRWGMLGAATVASTGAGAAGTVAAARRISPIERQQQILSLSDGEAMGLTENEKELIGVARESLKSSVSAFKQRRKQQQEAHLSVQSAERVLKNLREAMQHVSLEASKIDEANARLWAKQKEFVLESQNVSRLEAKLDAMKWDLPQEVAALARLGATFEQRYMSPAAARALTAAERVLCQSRQTKTSLSETELKKVMEVASWYMRQLSTETERFGREDRIRAADVNTNEVLRDSVVLGDMFRQAQLLGEAELLREAVENLQTAMWRARQPEVAAAAEAEMRRGTLPKLKKSVSSVFEKPPPVPMRTLSLREMPAGKQKQQSVAARPVVRQTIQFVEGEPSGSRVGGPVEQQALPEAGPSTAAGGIAGRAMAGAAGARVFASSLPELTGRGYEGGTAQGLQQSQESLAGAAAPARQGLHQSQGSLAGAAAAAIGADDEDAEAFYSQSLQNLEKRMQTVVRMLTDTWRKVLSALPGLSEEHNWEAANTILREAARDVKFAEGLVVHRALKSESVSAFMEIRKKCADAVQALADAMGDRLVQGMEKDEENLKKKSRALQEALQAPARRDPPAAEDSLFLAVTQLGLEVNRVRGRIRNVRVVTDAVREVHAPVAERVSSLSNLANAAREEVQVAGDTCARRWMVWLQQGWQKFENSERTRATKEADEMRRRSYLSGLVDRAEDVAQGLHKVLGDTAHNQVLGELVQDGRKKLQEPEKKEDEEEGQEEQRK